MPDVIAPTTRAPAAAAASSRKVVDLQIGDTLMVGDDVTMRVLAKSGKLARLVVCAPRSVAVKTIEGSGFVPSLPD